jgi:aryl-alcohol dehydrogenase-like predicted oxidoreductase
MARKSSADRPKLAKHRLAFSPTMPLTRVAASSGRRAIKITLCDEMAADHTSLGDSMTSLRNLGSSDLKVLPLNLGGNVFGWTADRDQSFAVLDAYTAAGGNFVDTADAYSRWVPGHTGGESETIIGEWLAARGNRSDVVIATKVGRHPEFTGLKADTIKQAAEASLSRLGTDYIDLYYTHFDDESVPVEEIMTALDELVRAGTVRTIGASNISPERLEASLAFSEREGLARYVALQPHYNLISRDTYEGDLSQIAERYGLAVIPYYSLASGFLAGKYRPGATSVDSGRAEDAAKYLNDDPARHLGTERGRKVLAALDGIALAHGAELATVALAWLAAQPTVVAPLASARTVHQLPALLAATSLHLTDAELAKLTDASA